jgi:hypothetical protein
MLAAPAHSSPWCSGRHCWLVMMFHSFRKTLAVRSNVDDYGVNINARSPDDLAEDFFHETVKASLDGFKVYSKKCV